MAEIMDILQEVRDKRNQELRRQNRTDISVISVMFLGEGKQTGKQVIRLIEKQEFYDKPPQYFEKFYLAERGRFELVAVKDSISEEILPVGKEGNSRQYWNEEREDIEECIEEREAQLKAIAKELGISEEEIMALSEIDLEQKVQEKVGETERGKEKEDEDKIQFSSEQAESLSAGNEINLDAQIDDKGTTLRKAIGLDEYEAIIVVHAYKLADITNQSGEKGKVKHDQKFGFIGMKKDGTAETISEDKLRKYTGGNREVTGIKNPEGIETEQNDDIFEIGGNSDKRLSIRQSDPYGIPEVYYIQNTRDNDGQVGQKLQDKYDGTERTDVDVRGLFRQNNGEYQADKMMDEAESHENAGCNEEELTVENIDGDTTTGHQHIEKKDEKITSGLTDELIIEIAQKCRVSEETARQYVEEVANENNIEEMTNEQIVEEAEEIAERDYGRGPTRVKQ